MALQLKYNLCVTNKCTQIEFTENTGFYSSLNLTGYGSPNITISSILTAILTITTPDNITYTINLKSTGYYPSSNPTINYTIPLSQFGNPTSIKDGEWKFVYTVTTLSEEYSTTVYKYFYCNSECCVKTMVLDIDTCDCCKETSDYKNYILAWTQLESLKKAAACGDSDNFAAIKKIIDKLCLNNGCKTCK